MTYNKLTLQTARLILRPFAEDDFSAMHSWESNPANIRYIHRGPSTKEETLNYLSRRIPGRDFAVTLKSTGEVIGCCGVYADEWGDTAGLGYILHMDHWNQGYATEFVAELLRYGFEDLKLRRIYGECAADNIGSARAMERSGMRREALHRKAFWARVDKTWIDKEVYAILAEEYFTNKSLQQEP